MAQTLPNVAQYLSLSCRREPRNQTRDPSCGGSWNRNPSQGITWIRDGSGDSGYRVEGKTTGSGESGWYAGGLFGKLADGVGGIGGLVDDYWRWDRTGSCRSRELGTARATLF